MAETHPIVVAPGESLFFSLPADAELVERSDGSPGVTFPAGFQAAGATVGLKQSGRPDMAAICVVPEFHEVASSAAVFTTNAFAAAPCLVTRDESHAGKLLALVINSGNANACTGPKGLEVARAMQTVGAESFGIASSSVAVASTGIIGVQLDKDFMTAAVKTAASAVKPGGGPEFGQAIMTTDRYPKGCAVQVKLSGGAVRIGACAKGAGMIAPAMATMICVVTTDAVLAPGAATGLLRSSVDASFNKATVDGEMSTNDCVFLLASGASGVELSGADTATFSAALQAVLLRLALMMVADGEGATKVIRITVNGAESEEQAARVCRAIADSPLVKTAMHGGDPNWGRIISSAGAAMAGRELPEAKLYLCGVKVVDGGWAAPLTEADHQTLVTGVNKPEIEIELEMALGEASSQLYFSDLGHGYITINAEYHS